MSSQPSREWLGSVGVGPERLPIGPEHGIKNELCALLLKMDNQQ